MPYCLEHFPLILLLGFIVFSPTEGPEYEWVRPVLLSIMSLTWTLLTMSWSFY